MNDKIKIDRNKKNNKKRIEPATLKQSPQEIGGYQGLEPTRYGDWEKKGRCIDF